MFQYILYTIVTYNSRFKSFFNFLNTFVSGWSTRKSKPRVCSTILSATKILLIVSLSYLSQFQDNLITNCRLIYSCIISVNKHNSPTPLIDYVVPGKHSQSPLLAFFWGEIEIPEIEIPEIEIPQIEIPQASQQGKSKPCPQSIIIQYLNYDISMLSKYYISTVRLHCLKHIKPVKHCTRTR